MIWLAFGQVLEAHRIRSERGLGTAGDPCRNDDTDTDNESYKYNDIDNGNTNNIVMIIIIIILIVMNVTRRSRRPPWLLGSRAASSSEAREGPAKCVKIFQIPKCGNMSALNTTFGTCEALWPKQSPGGPDGPDGRLAGSWALIV